MKRAPPLGNFRRVRSIGDNIPGVFTSRFNKSIQYESQLERVLVLMLDRDPSVVGYMSQPMQINYVDSEGDARTYVPDFRVVREEGNVELHEVTIEARRTEASAIRRESAARRFCNERRWRYVVHTERTLPSATQRANLNLLANHRFAAYAEYDSMNTILMVLEEVNSELPVYDVVEMVAHRVSLGRSIVLSTVLYLLWHGYITTDLNHLIIQHNRIAETVMLSLDGRVR